MNYNTYNRSHARILPSSAGAVPASTTNNGLIPSQGPSRPPSRTPSQTPSTNLQRHTPHTAPRFSSQETNPVAESVPEGPRLEPQQLPPLPTGSTPVMALPSSLLPLSTNIPDHSMDYTTGSPNATHPTYTQMHEVADMEDGPQEPQEPWWEAYARLQVDQDRNRRRAYRAERRASGTSLRQLDLEQRVDRLETQLGIRTRRR
jgi:hypothetical protein